MDLKRNLDDLQENLKELHRALRQDTFNKYQRINPFYEDIFDWKERGEFWTGNANGVTIYNSATLVGKVVIGEKTWVGPFSTLDGTGGLSIGRYCAISLGCHLASHDTAKWALSAGSHEYEYSPIVIGDCCFLGSHVVVIRGVTIGSHSLIGAGAVVTESVPPYTIMGGVPAKAIGTVLIDDDRVTLRYHSS